MAVCKRVSRVACYTYVAIVLIAVGSDVVVDTLHVDQVVTADAEVATTTSVKPDTGRGWRSAFVVEDAKVGASRTITVAAAIVNTLGANWDGNTESGKGTLGETGSGCQASAAAVIGKTTGRNSDT